MVKILNEAQNESLFSMSSSAHQVLDILRSPTLFGGPWIDNSKSRPFRAFL